MKKSRKMIAVLTVIAIIAGMAAAAIADEKVYTSPTFRIPKDRIRLDEPAAEPEAPAPDAEPAEEIMTPDTETDGGEEPAEEGTGTPAEPAEETAAPAEDAGPAMQVIIHSSRKPQVTKGDIIEMTSELIGFDGIEVSYQWQMDRNDGEGWVNATGLYANREMYRFVADEETVLYSWRLIVIPVE